MSAYPNEASSLARLQQLAAVKLERLDRAEGPRLEVLVAALRAMADQPSSSPRSAV